MKQLDNFDEKDISASQGSLFEQLVEFFVDKFISFLILKKTTSLAVLNLQKKYTPYIKDKLLSLKYPYLYALVWYIGR